MDHATKTDAEQIDAWPCFAITIALNKCKEPVANTLPGQQVKKDDGGDENEKSDVKTKTYMKESAKNIAIRFL